MDKKKYRAYLCFGPNCGPKGSSQLLDFLTEEVIRRGLDSRVSVTAGGCQSHCESGPTMVVYPGPVFYQAIDRERLKRIVDEHFAADTPVSDYLWTGVKRKIIPGKTFLGQAEKQRQGRDEKSPLPKLKRPQREVDDFSW